MAKRTQKGLALIVVLGVLALLAVSFSTLAATDRAVARNYLDTVRARLVAQSGIEAAVARLGELIDLGALASTDDWAPALAPLRVHGRDVRPSGAHETGTYARRGDFYSLSISDANARLNVNDGLASGPAHETSLNLRRILNLLRAQPSVAVDRLGDRLLAARPAAGYAAKAELLRAPGDDRAAFDRVADFLSDPAAARPLSSISGEPLNLDGARDRLRWVEEVADRERRLALVREAREFAREILARTESGDVKSWTRASGTVDRTLGALVDLARSESDDDLKRLVGGVERLFELAPSVVECPSSVGPEWRELVGRVDRNGEALEGRLRAGNSP